MTLLTRWIGLAFLLMLTGCSGTSLKTESPDEAAEVSDVEVETFVRSALGTRLVTSLQGQLATPPPMPDFARAVEETLVEPPALTDGMKVSEAYLKEILRPTPRPVLKANRDGCRIAAEVTKVSVGKRTPKRGGDVEIEFEAVQKQTEGLFKLVSADKLQQAIGWDRKRLADASSLTIPFPPARRVEFARRQSEVRATRNWVMELAHPAGSEWPVRGTIVARRAGPKWQFTVKKIRPEKAPTLSAVTREHFPQGLMAVDPADYGASAREWSRPYEELIASEATMAEEVKGVEARQLAVLKELLSPGRRWKTTIKTPTDLLTIELEVTGIRDGKFWDGTCQFRKPDVSIDVPVYGFESVLRDYALPEGHLPVPPELFGPSILIKPLEGVNWPDPFDKIDIHVVARPDDEAPTLIWLKSVLPTREVE
ncbi:hypothetical protein Pan44_52700 [Caulifigura coniformis]|uniref:Lipoprotein n=1 Tax=Caulifigura coniformis TaxID=2527983 RepID=A0A517SM55_9PLAN|nr:hypothetical protein [Caulifigura coniformis]QDT57203.1 hypothetical protein Pan44_52700 [Caulifigura coniformis]